MWKGWFFLCCILCDSKVRTCPDECRCDRRNRVYCNNRDLTFIPSGIPLNTTILYLQDNELRSSPDLENELQQLNQLERLMLYNNRLNTFPKLRSENLRELRINNNRISEISADSLAEVPKLANLILDENELTNEGIEAGSLAHLSSLKRISLNRNLLTEFPKGFSSSIQQIFLTDNKISHISNGSLADLDSLETLFLNRNKLSESSINLDTFINLNSLIELELSHNFFKVLPSKFAKNVEKLYLTSNQIEFVIFSQLDGLSRLRKLDLAYNHLSLIEKGVLERLESLEQIDLSGNNWRCDCHLKPMKAYLKNHPVHNGARESIVCGDSFKSSQFSSSLSIDDIPEEWLNCTKISFNISQTVSGVLIDSDAKLDELPPFAKLRLRTEEINTVSGMAMDNVVDLFPMEIPLSNLKPETLYRVCLYNSYIGSSDDIPEEFCINFKTSIRVSMARTASPKSQVIVGVIIGLCLTSTIFTIYYLMNYSTVFEKVFPQMVQKTSSGRTDENCPSRLVRSSKPHLKANCPIPGRHLTLDASTEFNVTLMLRPPSERPQTPFGQPFGQPLGQPHTSHARSVMERLDTIRNPSFASSVESDQTDKTLLSSRQDLYT